LTSIDGAADFPARGLNFMALPLSYSFGAFYAECSIASASAQGATG